MSNINGRSSPSDFIAHIAASYPILWIDTCEYQRCVQAYAREIEQSAVTHKVFTWDMISGISEYKNGKLIPKPDDDDELKDPVAPVQFLEKMHKQNDRLRRDHQPIQCNVMFANDYHLFIKSPEIWRSLLNLAPKFSASSQAFCIVSPVVEIPLEIKRYVSVIDFKLPTKDEIREHLERVIKEMHATVNPKDMEEIVSSGAGLTMTEFDNAVYLSLALNQMKILPGQIHKQKQQLIRKSSAMDVVKSGYGFERIVGLDNMKGFVKKMVGKKDSKGILVVGVPGSGKTAFAKALGKETGRLTISLDIGNLQGGIVGETEQQTKDALQTIDAMEPAILLVDEIEKALAGVKGYSGDSGTSKRQGGMILQWLNDHTSDVYVIATCNNIDELPPEYLRSGRWDTIFCVGFPSEEERKGLLNLYQDIYELDKKDKVPDIEGWTGAEIENLCKLSKNLEVSLEEASKFICPMIKVTKDVETMFDKVKGVAIPASKYAYQTAMGRTDTVESEARNISSI